MSFSNIQTVNSSWSWGGLTGSLTGGLSKVLGKVVGGIGTATDTLSGVTSKAGELTSTLVKGAAGLAGPVVVSAGKAAANALSGVTSNPQVKKVVNTVVTVAAGAAELSREAAQVAAQSVSPQKNGSGSGSSGGLPETPVNPVVLQTTLWGGIGLMWLLLWWLL